MMNKLIDIVMICFLLFPVLSAKNVQEINEMREVLSGNDDLNIDDKIIFLEDQWRSNGFSELNADYLDDLMDFCYQKSIKVDFEKILTNKDTFKNLNEKEKKQLNIIIYRVEILARGYLIGNKHSVEFNDYVCRSNGPVKSFWNRMVTSAHNDIAKAKAQNLLKATILFQKEYLKSILEQQKYKRDLAAYYYLNSIVNNSVLKNIKDDEVYLNLLKSSINKQIETLIADSNSSSGNIDQFKITLIQLYLALVTPQEGNMWLEKILKSPDNSSTLQKLLKMRKMQLEFLAEKQIKK